MQGDEDLDAEWSVQGEEDISSFLPFSPTSFHSHTLNYHFNSDCNFNLQGYEEGARGNEGEEGEEDGYEEGGRGEDVPGKALSEHYKVSAGTDQREATAVLELMAKKNLRDTFYHIRQLAILHYYAEQGKRRNKDRVIAENLTIEDDAGWERICPPWCVNKKDGWCALVRYWTEDEEFKAKSIQNKANRGKGGTHNQGNNPFPLYEKDMVAANGGQEIPRIQVWQTAHKKKELVEGKVVYYGKTEVSMESYKKAFKSLHGEGSDPLSQPLDEMAVMLSGGGKPHGRTSILNAVHKPTITLPRIRHMTSSSGVCMPPRPRRSTQTSDDALFEALRTGAPPPLYVEPPMVPPLPKMPTKTEFLAQLYGGTPANMKPASARHWLQDQEETISSEVQGAQEEPDTGSCSGSPVCRGDLYGKGKARARQFLWSAWSPGRQQ
ncbi:hypothetical protein ACQ4PT_001750 [Festuca glaucescens]